MKPERFLIDRMSPFDRKALSRRLTDLAIGATENREGPENFKDVRFLTFKLSRGRSLAHFEDGVASLETPEMDHSIRDAGLAFYQSGIATFMPHAIRAAGRADVLETKPMGEILVFKPAIGDARRSPAPMSPAVIIFFPGVRRGTISDLPGEVKGPGQGDNPPKKKRRKSSPEESFPGKNGAAEKQTY